MHNCIWNNVVFQPCRDSFRATLTLVCFFFVFFIILSLTNAGIWKGKPSKVQQLTSHLVKMFWEASQRVYDTAFNHAVLSPLLLAVFLLCILVHMCVIAPSAVFFFVVVFSWCVLLLLECRTVLESMPDSHLLSVCVFVLFVWNQLCTIIKLN